MIFGKIYKRIIGWVTSNIFIILYLLNNMYLNKQNSFNFVLEINFLVRNATSNEYYWLPLDIF